jgi:hypothetical protein
MDPIRKVVSCLICVVLVVIQSGCGTITSGSKQDIAVNSNPDGAAVTSTKSGMSATMDYTTPTTVSFERKGHYILTFRRMDMIQNR